MLRLGARETLVGLDLGRHALRAVWLAASAGPPRIVRRETLRLPFDSLGARAAIETWIEQKGLRSADCGIALPGAQSLFQPLRLPPDDPRTDAQAAAVEAVKYNEMVSDSMGHAFAPFATRPGERRLLLAMTRSAAVDEALRRAEDLKLRVVEIVPAPVALFNALAPAAGSVPTLFAGVGASGTDLAIGAAGGLFFVRFFGVGGRSFTDAFARALKIPFALAESRKESEGDLRAGSPEGAALRAVADQWLNEVKSCLAVYTNLFPEPEAQPRRLVLAGGGARLGGFRERAAEALRLEAVGPEAAGWSNDPAEAAEFATAVGLALAARGSGCPISLLPDTQRYEREFRRQKPAWVAAAAVAGLIFLAAVVGGYRDNQRKTALLRVQEAGVLARQNLAGGLEAVRERNERLRAMGRTTQALLNGGPLLRGLLTAVQDAKDPEDWITMIADADLYFEKTAAPAERQTVAEDAPAARTPPPPPPFNRVLIEGFTRRGSLATVKRLIERLAAVPFVASADLLSDDEVIESEASEREGTTGARRFVLDIRLKNR